jgi:superoxide oxidase
MHLKNHSTAYGLPSVALHWIVLLLMAIAYFTMEFKSIFPKGSAGRNVMLELHYLAGLSVFALVWLRMIANYFGTAPQVKPAPPPWQACAARLMHIALYILMALLPLTGWLLIGAEGKQLSFLGVEVPTLIGRSRTAAKLLEDIHELLANTGYVLISLHASAALFHHYIKRDNTLRLILPRPSDL